MDNRRRWAAAVIFWLTPAVVFMAFEWITGSLTEIGGVYLLLNLLYYYLIYLFVFGITNSEKVGFTVLNAVFVIWALAEYFVVSFRQRPIMVWDFLGLRTAMTVAGGYQYEVGAAAAAGVLGILVWTALIWLFPIRRMTKRAWPRAAAASILGLAAGLTLFYRVWTGALSIEVSMWEPRISYEYYGNLICTLRGLGYLYVKAPEGYSKAAVTQLQEEIRDSKEGQELPWAGDGQTVPENIICIMNESYSDLRKIGSFSTDLPFMECFDSLGENCIRGDLYMPVFGAMTCNSEFEMLTGYSMAFAPSGSVPYQVYMRMPSYSLAWVLKDCGYRTAAVHPYEKQNWNREEAYQAMGFDVFYGIEAFEDPKLVRGYVSDQADYEKIIRMTQEKEEGERLFVFTVTMQNHGGYTAEDYEAQVHLREEGRFAPGEYPLTEQYLTLMRESDQALEYLLEYYKNCEEPTMIVLFGDHQPSVEPEFYEQLYGMPLDDLSEEDYLRRYITPYLIWTNYPSEAMTGQDMSAQYLSCAILQRANLEMTDYLYFLNGMHAAAPVVHGSGYYTGEGVWENWKGWKEKKEYPMFHAFDMLQYHGMFGKQRQESLFRNTE